MRNVTLAVSALLAIAAASYGVGLGLGGYHLVGMPVGDLTVSELTVQGIKLDVDMENGIPFKMGLANFGVGAILNVVPVFGIEGGFEMHTGYKNKEAAVGYEIMGETNEWTEPEDNTTWKMMNLYVGGRANIPTGTLVEPFGGGGLIISINKFEPEDEWLGNKLVSDQYIQATNTGVYFGGGVTSSSPVKLR